VAVQPGAAAAGRGGHGVAGRAGGAGREWALADGWGGAGGVRQAKRAVVELAAVVGRLVPVSSQPRGFKMASPQETGHWQARDRTEETVRRAKLHLSTASNMLDCAATAITRACELAAEREGVGEQLAEDVAAVRSSALHACGRAQCVKDARLLPTHRTSWPPVAPPVPIRGAAHLAGHQVRSFHGRRRRCPGSGGSFRTGPGWLYARAGETG
jgi:hypothetical protein